jgi:hypothetical protein
MGVSSGEPRMVCGVFRASHHVPHTLRSLALDERETESRLAKKVRLPVALGVAQAGLVGRLRAGREASLAVALHSLVHPLVHATGTHTHTRASCILHMRANITGQ